MAQTRRRRRKRRGTQAGKVDRRGRGRPRSRQEARARARQQMGQKRDVPPTWGSAIGRAAFGGAIFFVLLVTLLGQAVGPSLGLAAFMTLVYVPMGHYIDRLLYRRRVAKQRSAREARGG